MEIYSFQNYHDILKAWLKNQPKQGRGVAGKLAAHLRISTVLMSQILNGSRSLQPEYAYALTQYMRLTANEVEYFLLLVQWENAGTDEYKKHLRQRIDRLRSSALEVKSRVSQDMQLSEEAKARFYSHWSYSAVRLMTDIPEYQRPETIAETLGIDRSRVIEILEFLVDHKLCNQEGGRFSMAIKSTHLENESPWIHFPRLQWRQKSISSLENMKPDSLYYTAPMVLSIKDKQWVRERLLQLIREITERARDSSSESVYCLIIDWFSLM